MIRVTYLSFHFIFTLPLLGALLWAARGVFSDSRRKALLGAWLFLSCIAFVYTTPWDVHLVSLGVWGYPEESVLATVRGVPVEEYAFFLLQTAITSCWFLICLRRTNQSLLPAATTRSHRRAFWVVPCLAYLCLLGLYALQFEQGTYFGLIIVWATPIMILHWLVGGFWLAGRLRFLARVVLPPTLYFWCTDWIALQAGTWHINPQLSLGPSLFGLPLEEALFFLVTNVMVAQGLYLYVAVVENWSRLRANALSYLRALLNPTGKVRDV